MKRFAILLAALAMLISFSACSVEEVFELLDEIPAAEEQNVPEASAEEIVVPDEEWDEEAPASDETASADAVQEEPVEEPEPTEQPVEEQPETLQSEEDPAFAEEEEVFVSAPEESQTSASAIDEDGYYYSKDEVALYIYTYAHLPDNYITKNEAQDLGWSGGKLEPYAPDMAIGGDRFGNYEGLLPKKKGRTYTECDIDTQGKKRGAKRIIFSNDGLIYYTEDHYETFELLYGEP